MIISSHATDCICHSVLIVHLVPIAIEAGVPHIQAAGLVGVMGLGTLIGRIGLGVLADRIGSKWALFTTLLTQTIPIPLLWWFDSIYLFYAVALMVGTGMGGHGTMYPMVTREYYGTRRVGILYGAFISGASSGMATGGFLGGLLHDLTGDYTLSILLSFSDRRRLAAVRARLPFENQTGQKRGRGAARRSTRGMRGRAPRGECPVKKSLKGQNQPPLPPLDRGV